MDSSLNQDEALDRQIKFENDILNEYLDQMENDKSLTTLCLSKMIDAKDRLCLEFAQETEKAKSRAQELAQKFVEEREKVENEFEVSRKELDSWSRNINDDHEAFYERIKQKLDDEKQKSATITKMLLEMERKDETTRMF